MDANPRHLSASQERARSAFVWLMRLQGDRVAEADVIEWENWCAAEPENLPAFDEACRFYAELQALKSPDRESFLALAHIQSGPPTRPPAWRFVARAATGWRRFAVAGIAAGALLLVGLLCSWQLGSTAMEARDYRVPRGVQRALVLADRSQVTLASASEVLSNFTVGSRNLELRTGEAYFEVKHDLTRPFVVRAGPLTVKAVGTQFDIRRTTGRTVVVVTEGAVDVMTDEPRESGSPRDAFATTDEAITSVRVHAGQQAVKVSSQRGINVSNANFRAAAAWRAGRLEYIMEPLGSVIEDVNRYTSRRIVIGDNRLRDFVFTGTVFRDHVDEWAGTLAGAFPIRAQSDADGSIRLELQPKDSTTSSDTRR
jgi:transmembrane sensor